jgi:penicillin amidase
MKNTLLLKATDEITIERISGGIPLIKAHSEQDMYFGIGYCHAIDRGMQMMIMKILGTGTASKYLSGDDEMLEMDLFFRRMNWHNNITDELAKLSQNQADLLQAYCDGVNAAFAKKKPWELKLLLGFKDFKWEKEDVVIQARMAGYLTLAQSQGEIERLFVQMVQNDVSKELLNELFPNILGDYDEALLKKIKLNEKVVPDAVKWNVSSSAFMASNNWVITGKRTASGFPLLANDPHLEINRLPAVWYELVVRVGERFAYSSTMPGIPILLVSRTNELAWGATYTFMDATDSWIENCKDGKYFKDNAWHEFTKRTEFIERKKGKTEKIIFYENEHGVLDGDPFVEGYYLSTRWSGAKSGAQSIAAGFNMWKASNVKDGMNFIGKLEPSFSWVLADKHGNIGFQMSGLLPVRKKGISGFAPIEGWSSENDWQGYYEHTKLPRAYNPEEGYIITTNNNLNHLGEVAPINMPMGEYRADRIRQLIESEEKNSIESTRKIHFDTYSLEAELFMEIIRPLLPDNELGNLLKEWDLRYDIDSKGATLFEMIYRSLYFEVFGKAMGIELIDFLKNQSGIFIDFYANFDRILLSEHSAWFKGRSREEIYKKAIENALKIKPEPWGKINQITLTNMLLGGKFPRFMGFDKGPFPVRGGRATVHQGQVYQNAGRKTSFAPSYRLITDMAENVVHTNLAGGVSDRSFSKGYNNDFSNWMEGIYKKIKL